MDASAPGRAPRLLYATKTEAWCDRFDPLHRALQAFPPGLPPRVPVDEVAFDLVLPDDLLDRKLAALRAQASQVAPLLHVVGEEVFRAWVSNECFRPARPSPVDLPAQARLTGPVVAASGGDGGSGTR